MQDFVVKNWSRDPHLTSELLESTRELNQRFLELAAVQSVGWSAPRWEGIALLSATQKAAAANCPYALFDVRFHDDDHWCRRLLAPVAWNIADAEPVDENVRNFVRLALFFAWHVASTTRPAAQLLLGMNEATVAAFRSVTMDRMAMLAACEAANLTARWDDCPRYWSALTGAATRPNPLRLRRIQLYGLQLAAAMRLEQSVR